MNKNKLFIDTISELYEDFDCNIDKFVESLNNRIDTGEYINKKYSIKFDPINIDYLKEQKRILDNIVKNDVCITDECVNHVTEESECAVAYDPVNKPYHYASDKYECIDIMGDTFGNDKLRDFCILNAFKYIYRHGKKNGVEDLKKARFYLDYAIEKLS